MQHTDKKPNETEIVHRKTQILFSAWCLILQLENRYYNEAEDTTSNKSLLIASN